MRAAASAVVVGVLAAAAVLTVGFPGARADPPESAADGMLPPSFRQIDEGPAGGTLWQGVIPNKEVPDAREYGLGTPDTPAFAGMTFCGVGPSPG